MDFDAVDGFMQFRMHAFERGESYDVPAVHDAGEFSRIDDIGRVPVTTELPAMSVHWNYGSRECFRD